MRGYIRIHAAFAGRYLTERIVCFKVGIIHASWVSQLAAYLDYLVIVFQKLVGCLDPAVNKPPCLMVNHQQQVVKLAVAHEKLEIAIPHFELPL